MLRSSVARLTHGLSWSLMHSIDGAQQLYPLSTSATRSRLHTEVVDAIIQMRPFRRAPVVSFTPQVETLRWCALALRPTGGGSVISARCSLMMHQDFTGATLHVCQARFSKR